MQTKGHRPRLFLLEATAKELDLGFRKILEEEEEEMDEGLNVLTVAEAAWASVYGVQLDVASIGHGLLHVLQTLQKVIG
jgi:hypothetical protein